MEYFIKASSVWFIGFFPMAEIYVAVPSGFIVGLDPVSTVFWSVTGNYLPIVMIHFAYQQMLNLPRLGPVLTRFASPKVKDKLDRHGFWFVALSTPWIGAWIVAASVKCAGMNGRAILLSTFTGITGYAVVIAALITAGLNFPGIR